MDCCWVCRRTKIGIGREFLAIIRTSWNDREVDLLYRISQAAMLPRSTRR